jgi:hypothetical protein
MRTEIIKLITNAREARKDFEAGLIEKKKFEEIEDKLMDKITLEEIIEYENYLREMLFRHLDRVLENIECMVSNIESKVDSIDSRFSR